MLFQIRRYFFSLAKYKIWLLLFLIPPVVFLIVTALIPSQFVVIQNVNITADTPLALMSSPIGTMAAGKIIAQPEIMFLNSFTLRALYTKLNAGMGDYRTDQQSRVLADTVKKHMSLRLIDARTLQIQYSGPDQKLGNTIVGFFSERLVRNAVEGMQRSRMTPAQDQKPSLIGEISTLARRTLLPSSHTLSFIQIAIASLLGALILAGILEYRDSSFKSERQMAEYLQLPILGSIPNLNRVYSAMEK